MNTIARAASRFSRPSAAWARNTAAVRRGAATSARHASTSTSNKAAASMGLMRNVLAVTALGMTCGTTVAYAKSTGEEGGVVRISVYDVELGEKSPNIVPCFIEVSQGSRNKYEWDNDLGFLKLDRILHSAVFYPHNYGFIPQTLCGDGDPLDVLIIGGGAILPGSWLDARPIGYMVMEDEKGFDEKVLAVACKDPRYNDVQSLEDVPEHTLQEIAQFFETYKALERKKWVKVGGWKGTKDTYKLLEDTHQNYFQARQKYKEGNIPFSHN